MRHLLFTGTFGNNPPNLSFLSNDDEYAFLPGGVAKINHYKTHLKKYFFIQWATTLQNLEEAARQTVSEGPKRD